MNATPPSSTPAAVKPPFDLASATTKVRMAEDAWNSRDPQRVALAYTEDSDGVTAPNSCAAAPAIREFLRRKWSRELDYRLIKEIWAFGENRIAVRFAYEWHDDSGHWFRSYGNENWEFDARGLMRRRMASINDLPIRRRSASTTGARRGRGQRSTRP